MTIWYSLILGNRGAGMASSLSRRELIILGCLFLAGTVVAQIPLWITRKVCRWRLAGGDAVGHPRAQLRLQFNLQQMLGATALVSIALAPLPTILPPEHIEPSGFGRELGLEFTLAAISGLLLTTPCVRGAMSRASRLIPAAFIGLLYCGVITALVLGIYAAILGSPFQGEFLGGCLLLYLCNLSQCATVFGTLLLLRALGFQLVRGSPPARFGPRAGTSVVSLRTEEEGTAGNAGPKKNP
jgi:hypothetical protein